MSKVYAYYLVNSDTSGILENWEKCQKVISKQNARYKSFNNIKEAQEWLNAGVKYEKKEKKKISQNDKNTEKE